MEGRGQCVARGVTKKERRGVPPAVSCKETPLPLHLPEMLNSFTEQWVLSGLLIDTTPQLTLCFYTIPSPKSKIKIIRSLAVAAPSLVYIPLLQGMQPLGKHLLTTLI
jgi:hypothetical protein